VAIRISLTSRHMSLYDYADKIEKATLSVNSPQYRMNKANDRPSPRASTLLEISEERPVLRNTLMLSYLDFRLSG